MLGRPASQAFPAPRGAKSPEKPILGHVCGPRPGRHGSALSCDCPGTFGLVPFPHPGGGDGGTAPGVHEAPPGSDVLLGLTDAAHLAVLGRFRCAPWPDAEKGRLVRPALASRELQRSTSLPRVWGRVPGSGGADGNSQDEPLSQSESQSSVSAESRFDDCLIISSFSDTKHPIFWTPKFPPNPHPQGCGASSSSLK